MVPIGERAWPPAGAAAPQSGARELDGLEAPVLSEVVVGAEVEVMGSRRRRALQHHQRHPVAAARSAAREVENRRLEQQPSPKARGRGSRGASPVLAVAALQSTSSRRRRSARPSASAIIRSSSISSIRKGRLLRPAEAGRAGQDSRAREGQPRGRGRATAGHRPCPGDRREGRPARVTRRAGRPCGSPALGRP